MQPHGGVFGHCSSQHIYPLYHFSSPSTLNLWRIFFPTKETGRWISESDCVFSEFTSMKSESSLMMSLGGRCLPFCVNGTLTFCLSTFFRMLMCSLITACFFPAFFLALANSLIINFRESVLQFIGWKVFLFLG